MNEHNHEDGNISSSRYCQSCGAKYEVGTKFCENCGAELPSIMSTAKNKIKSAYKVCAKKKWPIPVIGVALVALIVLGIIFGGPKTIDFTDYIVTYATGYNGYGELTADIDFNAIAEEMFGKAPDPTQKKKYEKYLEYRDNLALLEENLGISVSTEGVPENGQFCVVTVSVLDIEWFAAHGYEIKNTEQSRTLEIGLDTPAFRELAKIDLLSQITLVYDGENGDGTASISINEPLKFVVKDADGIDTTIIVEYHSSFWGYDSFEIRSSAVEDEYAAIRVYFEEDNLKNGDTVTLTLDNNNFLIETFGVDLASYERTYTVSGLEE